MDQDIFGIENSDIEQVAVEAVADAPQVEAPAPIEEVAAPPPQIVEQSEAKPEPGFVPFAAVLDERDKRKALEAEVARYRAQQQPQAQVPDVLEDPEGFAGNLLSTVEGRIFAQNRQWSERFAVQQFGAETTKAAKDWGFGRCEADPHFNMQVFNSPDPIGFVVEQYQREKIASQVSLSDFEQFQQWKAAQAQLAPQQQAAQAAIIPPAALPPPSIASAPNAGGIAQPKPDPTAEKIGQMFG